jgi:hypothetical protein
VVLAEVDDGRNEDGEGGVASVASAFASLSADDIYALCECFGNVLFQIIAFKMRSFMWLDIKVNTLG